MNDKTICIDFDGVIHAYSKGYHDGSIYDIPMPGAFDAMRRLLADGFVLVILTAREDLEGIRDWLFEYDREIARNVEVTNTKVPAIAYIDDRAIRFTNWDDVRKYFI